VSIDYVSFYFLNHHHEHQSGMFVLDMTQYGQMRDVEDDFSKNPLKKKKNFTGFYCLSKINLFHYLLFKALTVCDLLC
jgi:hypothetical protein